MASTTQDQGRRPRRQPMRPTTAATRVRAPQRLANSTWFRVLTPVSPPPSPTPPARLGTVDGGAVLVLVLEGGAVVATVGGGVMAATVSVAMTTSRWAAL